MYNLKQLFRINKYAYFILVFLYTILFSFFYITNYHMNNYLSLLNSCEVDCSGYLNGIYKENTYYINISPISGSTETDTLIVEYYMTAKDTDYKDVFFTKYNRKEISDKSLSENECSISKFTAYKYDLDIGDKIIIRSNFKDYEYFVKYIFDDFYNLNEPSLFEANQLVILGYNSNIEKNLFSKNYYYFSHVSSIFSTAGPMFVKSNKIQEINLKLILFYLSFIFISLNITIVFEIFFSKGLKADLITYKKIGFKNKSLTNYIFVDSIYKYGISWCFIICLSVIVILLLNIFSLKILLLSIFNVMLNILSSFIYQYIKYQKILK